MSREKYKRAALLMTEFLDDILNQNPTILDNDSDLHVNLDKIKETPIEKLDKEDRVALVLVLLKQLQPYLSSQNLSTQPPAAMQQNRRSHNPKDSNYIGQQADKVIQQHGASTNATGDIDALHSILNNINVQTKNHGGSNQYDGKLPPI